MIILPTRNQALRSKAILHSNAGLPALIASLLLALSFTLSADQKRDQKQAQLDAACEQAREKKLAPLRAQYVDECVAEKQRDSRAECEIFYSDYGAQSGDRAPLFYDLPECVTAFEYQQSERQR